MATNLRSKIEDSKFLHAELRFFSGRYKAQRLLRSHLGIQTFLGHDVATNKTVIIKTGDSAVAESGVLMRLNHEANVLANVKSPSLGRILDFAKDEQNYCLILSYVEGISLEEKLKNGSINQKEALSVALSLAMALQEIHGLGILHRDLKPSNVIVPDDHAIDLAVLIDFGFARSAASSDVGADNMLGTACYMSPEQAGLIDQGVGERSDLYSLGVLLYECLTGRPPFSGGKVGDVLMQHMTLVPPPIKASTQIAQAFVDIIFRLLKKDPRDRYQSAYSLYTDLHDLQSALSAGNADPDMVIGRKDSRQTLTEPAFVGRKNELMIATRFVEQAQVGGTGIAYLAGESGSGKTRLVEEVIQRALQQNYLVFRGQGLDQTAQHPFQTLNGIFEYLCQWLVSDPQRVASIKEHLGSHCAALCKLSPQFAKLFSMKQNVELVPDSFGEHLNAIALGELFTAIGSAQRPLMIVIDDCQWADEPTLKLIKHWHGLAREARRHTILLCAFRSDEVDDNHPLRSIKPEVEISLAGFSLSEVGDLIQSMAGQVEQDVVEFVAKLASGSPFMVAEILRGLNESGALYFDGHWQIDTTAVNSVQSSRKAAAWLSRRMEMLPKNVQILLSVGAILGKAFDLEMATLLAGIGPSEAFLAASRAQARHIIWIRAEGNRCIFVHDKLREVLLSRLPDHERQRLHSLVAAFLEVHKSADVFAIAYHYDAAGEYAKALPFAMAAATQARKQHALDLAEQQYRIAQRGTELSSQVYRQRIAEGLGEVLTLRGRYSEAQQELELARLLAENDAQRSAVDCKLGDLAFKCGDMEAASDALQSALELIGRRIPRTAFGFYFALVIEFAIQTLHTFMPRLFVGRRPLSEGQSDLAAATIFSRLAYAFWFKKGKLACLWAHLHNLNLVEKYQESAELAQAYSEHGPVMTTIPNFNRGLAYARKSLEIRTRMGNLWGQGQSHSFIGAALYSSSRYQEAVNACLTAERLMRRTGDRWEVNVAKWHRAYCNYRLGNLREAVKVARQVYGEAIVLGDDSSAGIALSCWSKASGGRVPSKYLRAQLAKTHGDAHTQVELLQADGIRLMRKGKYKAAINQLEIARRRIRDSDLRQEYIAPVPAWLLTAIRLRLENTNIYAGGQRQYLSRYAKGVYQHAFSIAKWYRNNLPHVLREGALLALMDNKPRKAERLFRDSMREARSQNAEYEYALTRYLRGRSGKMFGWERAEHDLVSGWQALQQMDAKVLGDKIFQAEEARASRSLSLVDRFQTVLEAGSEISRSLYTEKVFAETQRACRMLMRSDQCLIVDAKDPKKIIAQDPVHGRIAGNVISGTIVDRAVVAGKCVVSLDAPGDDPSVSMILGKYASVLCAPIYMRGEAVACMYVTHSDVRELYTEDDQKLADFIAALAGAALENSDGYQKLGEAKVDLERRVADLAIAQKEQEQAWLVAERANKAKSEFLANMSHEIRTPLGAIMGFAELMQMGVQSDQERELYVSTILRNGKNLLNIIDEILDISKVEAGKLKIEKTEVFLRREMADIQQLLLQNATEKKLQFVVSYADSVPDVIHTDPQRMRQILINVIGNAIKFTDAGSVEIAVTYQPKLDDEGLLRFEVIDTGIGIAEEAKRQLFSPFTQGDASVSRRFGGTGLGLALSRQLARALGGDVILERSELGKGSVFAIELAADVGRRDLAVVRNERLLSATRHVAEPLNSIALTNMSILVIDDSFDNQRMLARALRSGGARVDVASDGIEGSEKALHGKHDLVLMDIQMPGMNGYDAIKYLRKLGYIKPIVVVTAHAMVDEESRCRSAGCDDFMTKPIILGDLIKRVARYQPAPQVRQ